MPLFGPRSAAAVSRDLGLTETAVRGWVRQALGELLVSALPISTLAGGTALPAPTGRSCLDCARGTGCCVKSAISSSGTALIMLTPRLGGIWSRAASSVLATAGGAA